MIITINLNNVSNKTLADLLNVLYSIEDEQQYAYKSTTKAIDLLQDLTINN